MPAGGAGGEIGITLCPGKKGESYTGADWARNLAIDLDVIVRWRSAAVVTLIEDHEFEMLGVPNLGEQIVARGLEWHHLPIVDVSPPDHRREPRYQVLHGNIPTTVDSSMPGDAPLCRPQ